MSISTRAFLWTMSWALMAGACGPPHQEEPIEPPEASQSSHEDNLESPAMQVCRLEWHDVCRSDLTTCNIRCCDGYYDSAQVACSVCEPWAKGKCINRGGVKRIRWTP
jgi:hypothetical protein